MSAKHSRKSAKPASAPAPTAAPPSAPAIPSAAPAAADSQASGTTWIDSGDPRRRLLGKLGLAALWIYVAALGLLALDQTFNWGIFGPKLPPGL